MDGNPAYERERYEDAAGGFRVPGGGEQVLRPEIASDVRRVVSRAAR